MCLHPRENMSHSNVPPFVCNYLTAKNLIRQATESNITTTLYFHFLFFYFNSVQNVKEATCS